MVWSVDLILSFPNGYLARAPFIKKFVFPLVIWNITFTMYYVSTGTWVSFWTVRSIPSVDLFRTLNHTVVFTETYITFSYLEELEPSQIFFFLPYVFPALLVCLIFPHEHQCQLFYLPKTTSWYFYWHFDDFIN